MPRGELLGSLELEQPCGPAVLLDAGENDPRCPPWHTRKTAARLQGANRSSHPILLRVRAESGHVGSTTRIQVDQSADWLAFVMQELGMPVQRTSKLRL